VQCLSCKHDKGQIVLGVQRFSSPPLCHLTSSPYKSPVIRRVDEHIRIFKSLSPSSFTLADLYDELAVMAIIIRALSHSFNDVIYIISVLNKFDKQSVIQLLRNMDQMRNNLSGISTVFSALSASQKVSQRP
jgi:hypothetical protein